MRGDHRSVAVERMQPDLVANDRMAGGQPLESDGVSELVERAKRDPEAFGELYELYYGRILNYTYRCVLQVVVAEDLTSKVFFKAMTRLGRYKGRGDFGAWLYGIATNEIRMHWRSQQYRREGLERWRQDVARLRWAAEGGDGPDEVVAKMGRFAEVRRGLERLAEKYRTVLVLRYFEHLEYSDMARVLGKRVGTVKSLVHRGLKRLGDQIEDECATFGD